MRITDRDAAGGSCPHGWRKITSPVAACRAPSRHSSPKLRFWKFQLFICSKDRVMIADLRNI